MVKNFLKNSTAIFLRKQTNILSAASVIMAAVLLSRLLGLLRIRLLLSRFFIPETKWHYDAYIAASRFPEMIFELVVFGALSAAFIPVFSEFLERNKEEAHRLASSAINIISSILLVFCVVLFIFAPQFCGLLAPSYVEFPEKLKLMVELMRIMIIAQIFLCISSFFTGIIQSHQRFLVPAFAPVVFNIGAILGIVFLSPILDIYAAAWGVVIGAVLHLLIQLPLVVRLGFIYHFKSWDYKNRGVREIAKLMAPRSISLAVSQIEATISVFFATFLVPGQLALFYLAQSLMNIPIGLFGVTIGQAALPVLSQNTAQKDLEEFKKNFLFSFFQVLYLALPLTAILLVLRLPTVRLAFGVPNFLWNDTLDTGRTLALLTGAIVAQSVVQITVRGFYALHDTKTPLFVSIVSVLTNTSLAALFIFRFGWGIKGLAIAVSISSMIQLGLLLVLLNKSVGGFDQRKIVPPFAKIGLASLIMGIFLWVPMRFLDRYILNTTHTVELIILAVVASVTGLVFYVILSYLLKIEEFSAVVSLIKRLGKWREVLKQSDEIIDSSAPPATS